MNNDQQPKITAKQFDEAFTIMAQFLFEQYRKQKLETGLSTKV